MTTTKNVSLNIKGLWNKIKNSSIAGASAWFLLFAVSMFAGSFGVLIFGALFDIEFIVDAMYAINDIWTAIQAGTFSADMIDATVIASASNVILLTMCVSYIPVVITMIFRCKEAGGYQKVNWTDAFKWMAIITGANFVLEVIMNMFMAIPSFAAEASQLSSVSVLSTSGNPLLALFTTGIMAPIVEEIAFRRGLQNCINRKYNRWIGITVASVAFGVMHGNLFQGVFAGLMGLVLGYAYDETQNLWISTLMHIAVNSSAVLIVTFGLNQWIVYGILPVVLGAVYCVLNARKPVEKVEITVLHDYE